MNRAPFESAGPDYGAALSFLGSDEPYLLSTHVNADGDGIGAALALAEMISRMGRRCRIVLGDKTLDPRFGFLPGVDRIQRYPDLADTRPVPRAVFVDTPTASANRVGPVAGLVGPETRTLIIDHHADPADAGSVHLTDPGASSASELVYRLIQAAGVEISPEMATQVYAGIAYDTKLFKFSSPERALKVCAELVDLGADPQAIADALFAQQRIETVRTLGAALRTLDLHFEGRVSTLAVDHETYRMGGDLGVVVDHAMSIAGVQAALFFKEEAPGRHRVSLRSRGDLDVNRAAQAFGGGGHKNASGCVIELPIQEARRALLAEVGQMLARGSDARPEREKGR